MKRLPLNRPSRDSLAMSKLLSLVIALVIGLPSIGFVTEHGLASSKRSVETNSRESTKHEVATLAPLVSIVVNTTGDGDNLDPNAGCDVDAGTAGEQCTLRAAIQRANALMGDDTITFNIPTSQPNCDVQLGFCIVKLTKALPDLSDNVAINAPDPDKLVVQRDTGGDYRIFNVTNASTVTFSGLNISQGQVSGVGVFGAGIQNVNGTVNVTNCIIQENIALNSAGGAGISNGGILNVTDTLLKSNEASGLGGGINNSGTLTVTNSTFFANFARSGGGIVNSGTTNITLGLVIANTANDAGGGIHNLSGGTTTVLNSAIFGNRVTATGSIEFKGGGGIYNEAGAVSVTGSEIYENDVVGSGGGIMNEDPLANTLSVNDSTIRNNRVTIFGGGIFNAGFATITNSKVSDNTSNSAGGGIAIETPGITELLDDTISGNKSNQGGGGILVHNSSVLIMRNSTVGGNGSGTVGGGLAAGGNDIAETNTTNIINSTFYNNGATSNGGAIFFQTESQLSTMNITNSTITGNLTASRGGGIFHGTTPSGGPIHVKSTIIALNRTFITNSDVFGVFVSDGFNLTGNADESTGLTGGNDKFGTADNPLDPKVDPAGLQTNGGRTMTVALLAGSPAIDKGTANALATSTLTTDQRGTGFTRTFDDPAVTNAADGTDIGAFERQPAAPTPTPTPTPTSTPTPTPTPSPSPTPTPPTFQFDAATYSIEESCTSVTVRVVRSGPTGTTASIDITSEDGTAKQKGDYNFVTGHLNFAPSETEKVVHVLINDDSYVEGLEFANLILQHPINGTLGPQSTAMLLITDNASEPATNPIDDARGFVCQHYHDFLYREPDQAGEDFWTSQLEQCGTDAACLRSKRTDVSTAFFVSIEFQQTGYFVIRANKAAFGNLKSNPRYALFLSDQRHIGDGVVVGQGNWQQQLATNKQNYLTDFVSRAEFVAVYPQGEPAASYVDALFINVGVAPTSAERNAAIAAYGSGDMTGRAAALQSVVESGTVFNALYNPAFVLMQYYGYLRRNPDDAPDNNFTGYDFWLAKMNSFTLPGEDARNEAVALARVRRAEMVKAFIESAEYRERFLGSNTGNQQGAESIAGSTPRALLADLVASRNSAPPFRFRPLRT